MFSAVLILSEIYYTAKLRQSLVSEQLIIRVKWSAQLAIRAYLVMPGSLTLCQLLQALPHDVDVVDVVELVDHVGVVARALIALACRLVGHSVDLRGGSQRDISWTGDRRRLDWN